MSILVDDMKQLKLEGVVPRLRNGGGVGPIVTAALRGESTRVLRNAR